MLIPPLDEEAVYNEVPPTWIPSLRSPDIPSFTFALGRVRAVLAAEDRSGDPVVNLRCGSTIGKRACRSWLGGVWETVHGLVLVVQSPQPDTSIIGAYKGDIDPGTETDHLSESHFVDEHPILMTDVHKAQVWCRRHGSWNLDMADLRHRLDEWRWSRRRATLSTSSPAGSPGSQRNARPLS
jgi:hypothetical protein